MIKRYINKVIIIVHICTRASNPVIFEFGIVKRLEQLLIKRYINKVIIIVHICTRASNPVIFEFGIVKRLEQLLIKCYINKVIIIMMLDFPFPTFKLFTIVISFLSWTYV